MRRRVLFRRDVPLPAVRIFTWPGQFVASGKPVCVVPCGTFADRPRHRRRSWDLGPSQFSSGPGEPWPGRSAECGIAGPGVFPPGGPTCRFPWILPRFIFVEGLAAQSFSPTFLKEADNRGHPSSASGFFPGTSRSHGRQSAAAGRCCLGHFSPSRSSDVNETRPHRLDPVRANGSRPPLPAPCRSWASRRCSQVRPARCDIAYDVPAIGGPSAS
jgi:hypothetical protein